LERVRPRGSRGFVHADDGADMFAAQSRLQQFRLQAVDDLKALAQTGARQQLDQHAVKRQRWQVAFLQLGHGDVLDEGSARVGFGVLLVQAIYIFDQRQIGGTEALGQQI
jgi:hypothetical protein